MMASGNSSPESTTRNSDTPSMPRCHEIPKSEIHERFTSYWKPASWVLKSASSQSVIAPVPVANSSATSRWSSTRAAGTRATTTAPEERQEDGGGERRGGDAVGGLAGEEERAHTPARVRK